MKIMHTMASEARTKVPKRRFYSPESKLQIVGQCAEPGASIAAVALKHAINANIVHRWLREHSQGALVIQAHAFVPVTLSADPAPSSPPSAPPDRRLNSNVMRSILTSRNLMACA